MKTKDGYVQGYNAQSVATGDQIVTAADVTDEHNDYAQLHFVIAARTRRWPTLTWTSTSYRGQRAAARGGDLGRQDGPQGLHEGRSGGLSEATAHHRPRLRPAKDGRRARRFMRRSKASPQSEWNLLKL